MLFRSRGVLNPDLSGVLNHDLRGVLNHDLSGVLNPDLSGNISGINGDVTGITGNLDECGLTDEDRAKGVNIQDLIQ